MLIKSKNYLILLFILILSFVNITKENNVNIKIILYITIFYSH